MLERDVLEVYYLFADTAIVLGEGYMTGDNSDVDDDDNDDDDNEKWDTEIKMII
jgi:hypothetical protein